MAKSKEQIRQKAEQYFIENISATLKETAELFAVRPATASEWAKKYDWEAKRMDFHASPTIIKQKLQQETLNILNGKEASFSADAVAKLMAALDRCDKQADPIVIFKILKELDLFISQADPAFAKECTKWHKLFLQQRISSTSN